MTRAEFFARIIAVLIWRKKPETVVLYGSHTAELDYTIDADGRYHLWSVSLNER
jgi:hypothetical protein